MPILRPALIGCITLLMASCQSDGYAWNDRPDYEGIVQANYSDKVRQALLPEAQRQARILYPGVDAQWDFVAHFIAGYEKGAKQTLGVTIIGDGNGATQKGFDAGVRYFSESHGLSLLDFGYSFVEATGSYTSRHFEESAFRPDGSTEVWWVNMRDNVFEGLTDQASHRPHVENLRCTIRGYLQPQVGGEGHFGFYEREIVATGAADAEGG